MVHDINTLKNSTRNDKPLITIVGVLVNRGKVQRVRYY